MLIDINKIQLFQTAVCMLLAVLSIIILPFIQSLLLSKHKKREKAPKTLDILFSPDDFKRLKNNTVCSGELLIVIMFLMILLEYIFVKVSYASAFVCYIISLELVLFANWPLKITLTGFNDLPPSERHGDVFNRERHKINLVRYIRLLIFIPVCEAFVLITDVDTKNAFVGISLICIYFVFNYVINWIAAKYVFGNHDKTNINSSETCSFSKDSFRLTKEGLKTLLFVAIASLIFLKYISSL